MDEEITIRVYEALSDERQNGFQIWEASLGNSSCIVKIMVWISNSAFKSSLAWTTI